MKTIKSTDKTIIVQKVSIDEIQSEETSKLILTTKESDVSLGRVYNSKNSDYEPNSIVIFQSRSGSSMRFEGKEYVILFLEQILGTINE